MSLSGRLLKLGVARWQQVATAVHPTAPPSATEPGLDEAAWGEELFQEITSSAHHETQGWPAETIARVQARLFPVRPVGSAPLEVVVVWLQAPTAFTAPGRYIYLSRRLLERCRDDEAAAFIVAHETAHHDLGHIANLGGWLERVPRLPGGGHFALAVTARLGERLLHGPEEEAAADRRALELCLAAGFDGHRCLRVFDVLEEHALNWGDHDGAFGLEPEDVASGTGLPAWTGVFGDREEWTRRLGTLGRWAEDGRTWLWNRRRGYPSLRERRAILERQLADVITP